MKKRQPLGRKIRQLLGEEDNSWEDPLAEERELASKGVFYVWCSSGKRSQAKRVNGAICARYSQDKERSCGGCRKWLDEENRRYIPYEHAEELIEDVLDGVEEIEKEKKPKVRKPLINKERKKRVLLNRRSRRKALA